jgi:hypothetical protein
LAVNGGHGAINSLSEVHHGLQIWLHKLDSLSIAFDGKSMTFGGGILNKKLVTTLATAGKQAGKFDPDGGSMAL